MPALANPLRQIVRFRDNAKIVTFEDVRLAGSIERLQQEEPPRIVGANLDLPPGTYCVESRNTQPGAFWEVRLDPRTGIHIGNHSCPARAENPKANYPCVHIAAAWLCWKADQDRQDPFIQRLQEEQSRMTETEQEHAGTAVGPYLGNRQLTPYHVPAVQEIKDTLSLAKVLIETRGAALPKALDTPQKAAAVILAGRELGFDPMASFRHFYIVDGQTQPDGQAMTALMEKGGADLIVHCDCEKCADIELIRPGRTPMRVKYTMEQAVKAKSTAVYRNSEKQYDKTAWVNHPGDMLVWKAMARLARRGAADLINAVQSAMVRVDDFEDAVRQLAPEDVYEGAWSEQPRPALTQRDPETGEIFDAEHQEVEPSPESEAASESATAGTPSENTISPASSAPGNASTILPEPGPASAAPAEPTSPSSTPSSDPPAGTSPPMGSGTSPRTMLYGEANADKAANHHILSQFQKAIRGLGSLPEAAPSMSLNEIVEAMGGKWPEE